MGHLKEQWVADLVWEIAICYWTFASHGWGASLCGGPGWFNCSRVDEEAGMVVIKFVLISGFWNHEIVQGSLKDDA